MRRGAFWLLGALGLGAALVLWLNMVCAHRQIFGAVSHFFCGKPRPPTRTPSPPLSSPRPGPR